MPCIKCWETRGDLPTTHPEWRVYSQCHLIELRPASTNVLRSTPFLDDIPHHLLLGHYNKQMRRKIRTVKWSKSLTVDESTHPPSHRWYCRQISPYCLTQSWLSEDSDTDRVDIIHLDRDTVATQKSIGGGLCMVNNINGQPTTQPEKARTAGTTSSCRCPLDPTIWPVSLPKWPRYWHMSLELITIWQQTTWQTSITEQSPEPVNQPACLLGDFDRCDITTVLTNVEQYVTLDR